MALQSVPAQGEPLAFDAFSASTGIEVDTTMPEPAPAKRTRASVPRPRSGCNTCKSRHVRCDEARPECQNCIRTGRKCDGYTVPTSKSNSRLSNLASTLVISSYEIPFRIPGSQNDRRMFHYYCVHASHDLAGLAKSDFWTRFVLQCSQDERVVRSALLALSYEHLDYVTRDPKRRIRSRRQDSSSLEGLQQHNRAVRQLRRYIGTSKKPSVKAVLVCCILFYHFECFRDEPSTAQLHLRNGLAILRSQKEGMSPPSADASLADPDMQELIMILSVLDTEASLLDVTRMPELDLVTEEGRQGITPCVGPPGIRFQTLKEANFALIKLQNWIMRLVVESLPFRYSDSGQLAPHISSQKTELVGQCQRWSEGADAFEESISSNAEDSHTKHMFLAQLRLGLFGALSQLHALIPYNPAIFHSPNALTNKLFEQLSKLVPALVAMPRPQLASVSGASRAASPADESEDDGRSTRRGSSQLLLPRVNTRSRSPSPSPSPLPDTVPNSRSFCAQGNVIGMLFILAAKTVSKPFRDQLMQLLSQLSERREGQWSGAAAYDVLRRLQEITDPQGVTFIGMNGVGGNNAASDDEGEESDEEAGTDDGPDDSEDDNIADEGADDEALARAGITLNRSAREYASHMLDAGPFCAVAALMHRGLHGERCAYCEEPHTLSSDQNMQDMSLEAAGARNFGGIRDFERVLRARMHK